MALHCGERRDEAERVGVELGERCAGVYQADLADPSGAGRLWEQVGAVDALVNNAGVYLPLDFLTSSEEAFQESLRRTFAINLESPIALMRLAASSFAARGGGKILNVASRVGFKGEANAAFYAASKAALINLTRSLAVELAPKQIGVFGIAPGWVETAMTREGMDARRPAILESIPLGRVASPEDCAAAAAFLLSEEASYLSGMVIDINGASYFH